MGVALLLIDKISIAKGTIYNILENVGYFLQCKFTTAHVRVYFQHFIDSELEIPHIVLLSLHKYYEYSTLF